jgi:hypothetical protein
MRILRVPCLFGFRALALLPGIALVRTGVAGPDLDWTLRHEAVHHEQMRRDGWSRFLLRYLFSGEWRARYEAEAFGRTNLVREAARGHDVEAAARRYARHVAERYFPRLWLGRPPDTDRLADLMRTAMPPADPPARPGPHPPGAA